MQLAESSRINTANHLVRIQECFDDRRNGFGTLNVQHVSGAGNADHFGTGKGSAQRLNRAVGAQAREVIRLLSQHHQERRTNLPPGCFGVFALVENGIYPVMTWIRGQTHTIIAVRGSPDSRDERCGSRRESPVTKLNDGGQLLKGTVVLFQRQHLDLIQPFAHAFWRVLRRGARLSEPFERDDAAHPPWPQSGLVIRDLAAHPMTYDPPG